MGRLAVCSCPHGPRDKVSGTQQQTGYQQPARSTWDLWQGQSQLFPSADRDLQVLPRLIRLGECCLLMLSSSEVSAHMDYLAASTLAA